MDILEYINKIDSIVNSYLDGLNVRFLKLVLKDLKGNKSVSENLLNYTKIPKNKFNFLNDTLTAFNKSISNDILSLIAKELAEMESVYDVSVGRVEFYKDVKNLIDTYVGRIPSAIYNDVVDTMAFTLVDIDEETAIKDLSKKINKSFNQAKVLLRESLVTTNRNKINKIYEKIETEDTLYIYDGPLDSKTSPICRSFYHRRLTRKQWIALKPDIFQEGGHFGCRHVLRLLLKEDK